MVNVSIIITSYNKGNFIKDAILSVLYQTHTDWELLIVDDCSTDNTINVISSYLTDNRIKLIKNDVNKGANYCRNIGLKTAQGTYVVFLDADDVLTSLCLGKRMEAVSLSPGADLYVFSMGVFVKNIGDDNRKWIPKSQNPLKDFLQHKLPWGVTQPLWNVNFLKSIGGFNEQMDRLQDVELHTRALLNPNVKYFLYPNILDCYYRIDDSRKNFTNYQLLKKLIKSGVIYCDEFEKVLDRKMIKLLFGTIFQLNVTLLYYLKNNNISIEEYYELRMMLFNAKIFNDISAFKKNIFDFSILYNKYFFSIPGINKITSYLVVM